MKHNRSTAYSLTPAVPTGSEVETASPRPEQRVNAFDRALARGLLEALGAPPIAIVLWSGEAITLDPSPSLRMCVNSRAALFRLIRNPELHFGDLYSAGHLEVEGDLVAFLESAYRGVSLQLRRSRFARLRARLTNRPRTNSLEDARDNIHHHYDLGNDFYRLWLDDAAMQYTCAYFPDPAMTLEQAQLAKLDHVARKLRLKPGERVVEAGCGWGGLARHFARHFGVTVRAYNISRQQVEFARARAQAEGLAGKVEYVLDDYRNIEGEYDVFVSIGMLEHVGPDNYRGLGDVINRCLAEDGRGLIHSIGRNQPGKMNAWVEKRIFPGAYPPTLGEMKEIFEPHELSVLDVENLRLHYAVTLDHWLKRFQNQETAVERMFDKFFVRAWRLYLAGSKAAFTTGSLQLFQVLFARGSVNDLPWSRTHLYR
jgi:cyclopropane-fatty-acyl-phospholipid synthase